MAAVAARWSITLGQPVTPEQVVLCLIDLKLSRLSHDPQHYDSDLGPGVEVARHTHRRGSHAVEGDLLAVWNRAGDGQSAMAVRAQRDRVATQWQEAAAETIEAVHDLYGGRALAGLTECSTIHLNFCELA
jgi:hypothetical protein